MRPWDWTAFTAWQTGRGPIGSRTTPYVPKDGDDGTYVLGDRKADREDKATAFLDGDHPLSVDT